MKIATNDWQDTWNAATEAAAAIGLDTLLPDDVNIQLDEADGFYCQWADRGLTQGKVAGAQGEETDAAAAETSPEEEASPVEEGAPAPLTTTSSTDSEEARTATAFREAILAEAAAVEAARKAASSDARSAASSKVSD